MPKEIPLEKLALPNPGSGLLRSPKTAYQITRKRIK